VPEFICGDLPVFLKASSQQSAPDFVLSDYFAGSLVSSIQEPKDFILGNIFVENVFADDLHRLINIIRPSIWVCGNLEEILRVDPREADRKAIN
jgi:hypothetical protein